MISSVDIYTTSYAKLYFTVFKLLLHCFIVINWSRFTVTNFTGWFISSSKAHNQNIQISMMNSTNYEQLLCKT